MLGKLSKSGPSFQTDKTVKQFIVINTSLASSIQLNIICVKFFKKIWFFRSVL